MENYWISNMDHSSQDIRFSSKGAAYQNYLAGRVIKNTVYMKCKILIHASMKIPEGAISADLWPMSMYHAVFLCTHTPKIDRGLSQMTCGIGTSFLPPGVFWVHVMYGGEQSIYWNQDFIEVGCEYSQVVFKNYNWSLHLVWYKSLHFSFFGT